MTMGVGMVAGPETARRIAVDIGALVHVPHPWAAEGNYRNFIDTEAASTTFHTPSDLARLRRIRDEHDPGGVIRSNHPLD